MNPELLQKYLAGELTATETAELKRQLQSDPAARRQFARGVMDEGLFVEAAGMVAVELAKPQRDRDRRAFGRARWLALAAGLALAVAGGLWLYPRLAGTPTLGLRVTAAGVACRVSRVAGGDHPVAVGMELQQGDRVTVANGAKVTLKYDGEATTLDLHSAVATFGAEKGAKRVRLDAGLLVCTAAPQRQPFRIETPHAVAEVVGTRFWLDVAATETTLAVQEGKVALHQKAGHLQVNAGETAVADGSGMKKLSAEDAWVKDLLARAEAGPWNAVDFAQGTIRGAAGAWRLDRRGEPAGWRLWQTEPRATSVLLFEGAKWKRGVIVGRVMILPEEKLPVALAVPPEATAGSWQSKAGAVDGLGDLANGIYLAFYQYAGPQKRGQGNVSVAGTLTADQHPRGVWYRFVLYFDTAPVPETGMVVILGLGPEGRAVWPAELWRRPAREIFKHITAEEVGIGLMAKGVPALWQGVKLVPLGPDLPPPPASTGDASHQSPVTGVPSGGGSDRSK